MPKKLELSHTLESTRGSVRIPNPVPDELVRYWDEVMSKVNPRLRRAAEIGFADGKVGHICKPPVTEGDERLLIWATSIHPGIFFYNEDGDVSGAHLCPCIPCAQRIGAFCMETGVNLIAQQRGDFSYTRTDDNTVEMVECRLGEHENWQQLQTANLAGNVALRIAEQVTQQVRQEVSRQLAAFFAAQARNTTNTMRKQMLIVETFRQQSDMQRGSEAEVDVR